MIDEIKGMFSEKMVPTLIILGFGVIVGVVFGCFTPIKKLFRKKR